MIGSGPNRGGQTFFKNFQKGVAKRSQNFTTLTNDRDKSVGNTSGGTYYVPPGTHDSLQVQGGGISHDDVKTLIEDFQDTFQTSLNQIKQAQNKQQYNIKYITDTIQEIESKIQQESASFQRMV